MNSYLVVSVDCVVQGGCISAAYLRNGDDGMMMRMMMKMEKDELRDFPKR